MLGVVFQSAFLAAGLRAGYIASRNRCLVTRLWMGSVFGMFAMIWIPALFAFAFGFTAAAHIFAAVALVALYVSCELAFRKKA